MKQAIFELIENEELNQRFSRLSLKGDCSGIEKAGQFVSLSLPGFFLRRPFSVCDWDEHHFSLIVEQVGKGTELLRSLQPGAKLDVLTGLGNGFDLNLAGERPLLIGGGSGVSPLLGLARQLLARELRPHVILGFARQEDLILLDDFFRLGLAPSVTTDDGSFGIRGRVTDGMNLPHTSFYACGPVPMLRAVCEKSIAPGEVSLDARMGCGFGACMGCTIETAQGPKRVCKNGPVFRKEALLWED